MVGPARFAGLLVVGGWGMRVRAATWLTIVMATAVWCVGSGLSLVWGWRYGWRHGPVPGGCGCFNPAVLVASISWGILGAGGAVAVWSALFGAVGLAAYLRTGRLIGRRNQGPARESGD